MPETETGSVKLPGREAGERGCSPTTHVAGDGADVDGNVVVADVFTGDELGTAVAGHCVFAGGGVVDGAEPAGLGTHPQCQSVVTQVLPHKQTPSKTH